MSTTQTNQLYPAEPARGWMPWGALAPFLALAFVIVTALSGDWLISPHVNIGPDGDPLDPAALVAFTLVPFGLLLLVLLAWVRFVERRPLASVGIRGEHQVREFLRGHAIGLAGLLGVVMVIWAVGGVQLIALAPAFSHPGSLVYITMLLFTFALQASVEELLFRGWLLSVLAKKFNVTTAVVVSSALFSLMHFNPRAHWLVAVGTLLFALFACAWVLRTRNILGIMGWHAGWNWLLAIGFGLPVTGIDVGLPALLLDMQANGPDWLTGGAQGPEASVICFGYFLLGIAWIWRSSRKAAT
ncbi:MAG: CPBP family intramembrane metalloprotease [Steroidobacteraceae bacterium]|nr:CPBP family intramembrane metalloprotease [Steroidobacteraceae bacterium]